jgi:hypothetical protein
LSDENVKYAANCDAALTATLKLVANRCFRDPWFAVQVAEFRRAPVHIEEIEKGDLMVGGRYV